MRLPAPVLVLALASQASSELAQPSGRQGVEGALEKLDLQFLFLLSHITAMVPAAVSSLAASCQDSYQLTKSYGLSLLAGGALDTAADFVDNSRSGRQCSWVETEVLQGF